MISRATIFWLIALAGMVLITVTVSLKVNHVNAAIQEMSSEAREIRQRIALLDASYQLLVSPDQLAPMVARHLQLSEVRGDQLVPLDQLPARIPLPSARAPEPVPGQTAQADQDVDKGRQSANPVPSPPSGESQPPGVPPWLQAQGRNVLQPVSLQMPQGRSK